MALCYMGWVACLLPDDQPCMAIIVWYHKSEPRFYVMDRSLVCSCSYFLAVTVAWVFFRAESIDAALKVLRGMTGLNGFILPSPLLPILNHVGSLVPT